MVFLFLPVWYGRSLRSLLPFDGARRLAGEIVANAIDAHLRLAGFILNLTLVDDTIRHIMEQLVRKLGPIGGHEIRRIDASDAAHGEICAAIALHTYRFHVGHQHHERLRGLIVPDLIIAFFGLVTGLGSAQSLDEDIIILA